MSKIKTVVFWIKTRDFNVMFSLERKRGNRNNLKLELKIILFKKIKIFIYFLIQKLWSKKQKVKNILKP